MALKKWLSTHLFSKFMADYNDNLDEIAGMITSGTNANGHYTKFADGTLICRHSISVHPSTTAQTFTWTYPHAFWNNYNTRRSAAANIQLSCAQSPTYTDSGESITAFHKLTELTISPGTYDACGVRCVFDTINSTREVVLFFTAIGRWKG